MNSSVRIRHIKNLANDLEILNLGGELSIEATQYTPSSITLELTAAYIGDGQLVSLAGDLLLDQQKIPFEAVAKVVAIEVISGPLVQFEFQLKQFEKNNWKKFLMAKEQAQDRIDELLKKMKE